MKIRRIKFENFRNFKGNGEMDFPTDGTVSIIYGANGVGKTTLHQLFQWIFYGEEGVHFNKTASNKMYNLEYEQELPLGTRFFVKGSIDFEQLNQEGITEYYSIHREWEYKKELPESIRTDETVHILKKIDDDWKPVTGNPEKVIEQFLPSGLSDYFFFDGESMIADLNQKGRDSAKALRKALYSLFDLDIYEQAISHIGSKNTSSTVLGKLNMDRSLNSTDEDVLEARAELSRSQNKVEITEKGIKEAEDAISDNMNIFKDLSEKIGGVPSKASLEERRAKDKETIKTFEDAIKNEVKSFGNDIMSQYPYLFLSRIVEQAKLRLGLKVEDEEIIPGLKKELIEALQKEDTCICGRPIGGKEQEVFDKWLTKFPPLSYSYVYTQFKDNATRWSANYDPDLLKKHLDSIFRYQDEIDHYRQDIRDIDEELKNGSNVDQYIQDRATAEERISFWENKRDELEQKKGLYDRIQKQRSDEYDKVLGANKTNEKIEQQMELVSSVCKIFEEKLASNSELYSSELCKIIQELLDEMLTSVRTVEMTPTFELSVKDSYGDEAKSEGQFAVISFAYIGGILKLLSNVPELKGKEFPLVLDGPFSKLDVIQRQNVVNTIPSFAPQIILFSKDDLTTCFENIPNQVWTIYSNDERNVSYVKEGYNKEVFVSDEN